MVFKTLYVGDRFVAHGSLWTKIDVHTARQHSEHSIRMGAAGYGHRLDSICTFEADKEVQFVTMGDPDLLDGLRRLCGFVEDGTSDVVTICQDDATREWCITSGHNSTSTRLKHFYGKTFREALAALPKELE